MDVKTNLPISMENQTIADADGPKTVVLTDFVFDAPLDPALFATTIPEGYESTAITVPKITSAPVESDLVDLFAEYAKRSGGRFPIDLQLPSLLDVLNGPKLTEDGFDPETTAWITKVGKGVGLIWAMPPASDARYTGKNVTLGDAEKPIFRYKPLNSKTYRVIYGDLSVKNVAIDDIPK